MHVDATKIAETILAIERSANALRDCEPDLRG